jgi:hypothetical protein
MTSPVKFRHLLFIGAAAVLVFSGPRGGLAAEEVRPEPPPPLAVSTTPALPAEKPARDVTAKKERVNLWPFIYYSYDPQRDAKQLNFFGPIIRSGETPEASYTAVSPFFFSRTEKKTGDAVTELLWPYGTSKRRGEEERTRLSPFFESNKDESPKWNLFSIYGGRSSKGESYGGIFPFAGTLKERFGHDEGSFLLFPLFAQNRRDENTTTHILWPFFSFTTGPTEEGFRAWPFFGWKNEKGRMESSFIAWPFWVEKRKGLDTENPKHFWMLFPFYGETTSPDRDSWVALWPFIHYAKDKEHDYTTFSLFPLLNITQGSDREAFKLLPLFGYEKTKSSNSSFIVAPFIYGTKSKQSRNYTEKQTRWLLFSKDWERTWIKEGKTAKLTHVWPFLHYKKSRKGVVQVAFPSIFPRVSDSFQRNWPFLTLFGYRKAEDGRVAGSLLWNLFTYERDEQYSSMELAYIFDYSEDRASDTKEFKLLKGLFSYRTTGEGTRYSFLYLPWGIKTGPPKAPAAKVAVKKTEPPPQEKTEKKVRRRIIFESVH